MQEIGEAENALSCRTNNADCCKSSRSGEFYYSNGTMVPIRKTGHGFYRDRGVREIRLNRLEEATLPMGKFRCEIPDANGDNQNLYITLVWTSYPDFDHNEHTCCSYTRLAALQYYTIKKYYTHNMSYIMHTRKLKMKIDFFFLDDTL